MSRDSLARQVNKIRCRLGELRQQAAGNPQPAQLAEALAQLATAVDLLQTAEEKLRQQSQTLHAAQQTAQAERQRYRQLLVEHRQAEEALRQEHQAYEIERKRLRSVLDIIPAGLWVVDETGEILIQSAMSRDIWAEDSLPDDAPRTYKGWWSNSGQKIAPKEWSRIRAVTKGETSLNEEIDIEAFDGSKKTILSSATPIKDEQGNIVGAIVLNMDITRRKAQEALLKEERARIARDLHDGLAQNLYFLGLKLDYIRKQVNHAPDNAIDELAALKQNIQANIQEVRRTIFALRPVALEELGFLPAMQKYVREFGEQVGLETNLTISGNVNALPEALEPVFFRLVQEGLTNIAKHAQAQHVWIEFTVHPGQNSQLSIRDNGIGFDLQLLAQAGSRGKIGLRQMQERITRLNGHFNVESSVGRGTTLQVEIPLTGELR